MAQYYTNADRRWARVDVRGTVMDKSVIWDRGFDVQSSLFRMAQGLVIKPHTHLQWVQVVVLEGEMQIESDQHATVRVPSGGCYVLTPGDTHTETALRDTIVLVTQLNSRPQDQGQQTDRALSI